MVAVAQQMEVGFGNKYFSSVAELPPSDGHRVNKAVAKFIVDPKHRSLNFEKLHAMDQPLWSIRASDKIRVVIWREGARCFLLEAGQHDIYKKYERGRFRYSPNTGFIGIIDTSLLGSNHAVDGIYRLAEPVVDNGSGVLDHWSDADLRELGCTDDAIYALRTARTEEQLVELNLPSIEIERAIDVMEITPEQWRTPTLIADDNAAEQRMRRAIEDFGAAHGLSPFFTPEEVAKIAAAPIEEWMIFLHPDQRGAVRRRYEGPARVRGAAGTGKTVVALHRAAELAIRFRAEGAAPLPILFTTYIKTLPPIFEGLYNRLPNSVPGAVEFVSVDKLARRIVTEDGIRAHIDTNSINAAFKEAFTQVVAAGTPLAKANLTRQYLRDEITNVIRGRGIITIDHYLEIERTGRTVPFAEALRRQTWTLMEAWREGMDQRKTVAFSDVLLFARDAARARNAPTYRAAIVDEAQDLTLVGLQFVRALVNANSENDSPDGLLLVGDGAQRIYPGCFTLRQAGIEVTGRSTVLKTNYRNTAEILGAAFAIAGDAPVEDLDGAYRRSDEPTDSLRESGVRPALVECNGPEDEDVFVASRIQQFVDSGAVAYGDIGVFVPTNRHVKNAAAMLESTGVPCTDLASWAGTTSDTVKVGTYHRAKGLEFKVVFLPGLDERFPRPPDPGQDPEEYSEQCALAVSQLFVAMTRARDALFLTTPGSPSPLLVEHIDAFDVIES
ncbi:MAG: hypothetical protein EXQ69_10150 [Acidimicrobiia bacterium]|nr:hypothetical protein [Acidimicrobiia bacterium]